MPDVTLLDYLAFGFFVASWFGYALVADYGRLRQRSIMKVMDDYRERWMLEMLHRDPRIVDTNIIAGQQNGAAFFASTSIFALGGMIAALAASDEAVSILASLPLVHPGTPETWRIKVLLLIVIMAHAFFKFAWTFRLHNYSSILVGATPSDPGAEAEGRTTALRAAKISALAARHFNRGLRSYFFALAALAWFLHPGLFIGATVYVIYILYRREFRSKSLRALKGENDASA